MKTLLMVAVLPFWAVSCTSTDVSSIPQADTSTSDALFNDMNRYRVRMGKAPLTRHAGLDRLAREHSESMKKRGRKPDHLGFSNRAHTARTRFGMSSVHENAAVGSRGTSFTRLWAGSRAHAPAMRARWDFTGVAVTSDKDGYLYATQIFATGGLKPGR